MTQDLLCRGKGGCPAERKSDVLNDPANARLSLSLSLSAESKIMRKGRALSDVEARKASSSMRVCCDFEGKHRWSPTRNTVDK